MRNDRYKNIRQALEGLRERCAQEAERVTGRRRMVASWVSHEAVKPCEVAAAIRKIDVQQYYECAAGEIEAQQAEIERLHEQLRLARKEKGVNTKFEVTLAGLREAGACYEGYNRVVRALQEREFTKADAARKSYIRYRHDGPIKLTFILESNGLDDSLWALRCVPDVDRDARLFAVWCVRQVEHLMTDQRSKTALDVAERFANGEATEKELDAARDAAYAAARDAVRGAARGAARDAARDAACAAACAAARTAAWDAAYAAAWGAACAAACAASRGATRAAARTAAWDAACAAARAAQSDMLIAMCEGRAPWQVNRHAA